MENLHYENLLEVRMSWAPLECDDCKKTKTFEGAAPWAGCDKLYAVSWLCQSCGHRSADLCTAGPDHPAPSCCLNCGGELSDDKCTDCGTPRAEIVERIQNEYSDESQLVAAAEAASKRGLIRLALNMLDYRLENNPDDMEAWKSKAIVLQSIGLYGPSIPPLQEAIELSGPPTLLISLGCAFFETGAFEDAVKAYERFREESPEGEWVAVSMSNQANALDRLGEFDDARRLHDAAIEMEPEQIVFRLNLRAHLADQKRYDEALEVLDEALSMASTGERAHILHLHADTLCELERGEEALKDIVEALKDSPNNPSRNYVHGWALGLVGRADEAREAMHKVLELDPDHAAAKRGLKMIESAIANAPKRKPWWKIW